MTSGQPSLNALAAALLRRRVTALFDQLPRAVAGDAEAIHELRIAGRRLRVALPVLALRSSGKRQARCREALYALTRASGAARDLDVAAGLLDAYLAADAPRRPQASLVRRHMLAARRRSRARLAQTLLDADIRRLRADTTALLARGGADQPTALSRCARRAQARHGRVVARLAALGTAADMVALHSVRRSARRLRYLLELHDELGGAVTEAPRLLKGLQDALGRIHDLHVLAVWLQGHARRARARAAKGQVRQSNRLRVAAEQELARWHRKWLNYRPQTIVSKAMDMAAVGGVQERAVRDQRRP